MAATEIVIANSALAELGESQVTLLADKSAIGLQTLYDDARNELLGLFPWAFALKRTRLKAAGLLDCSAKTITFVVNSGADTITDSGSGFVTGGFVGKERIRVEGSGSNDTDYRLNTVVAGTLTLETYETVKAEALVNDADLKLYACPASKWDYKYAKPSDSITIRGVNGHNVDNMRENVWDVENDYIVTSEIDEYDEIDVEYIQKITDTTKFSDLFTQVLILRLAARLCMPITQDKGLKEALEARAKAKMLDNMAASEGSRNDERENSSWQDR